MAAATPQLPRLLDVRQHFAAPPPLDLPATVAQALNRVRPHLRPGARIAVAVGSRGIARLATMVSATLDFLRSAGCDPFIVPAMGSHGGATPEGQTQLLADYGVTAQAMGVPVRAALTVTSLGTTDLGLPVWFSTEALAADGLIVLNRVKPHTDFFSPTIGSGVIKMLVVGLGKEAGAAQSHRAASHHGYEAVLRSTLAVTLARVPLLCGLAVVEGPHHDTVRLEALLPGELIAREAELLAEARRQLPGLPLDPIDLLIVDRLGKNISGTGMDTNVIGRSVHGYSTALGDRNAPPHIGRLFVRDLTPETHGNAIGIGLADFTTTRLVQAMDPRVTFVNALTSLTAGSAKVPVHFATDREAIAAALQSLALEDMTQARIVRIADTLSLERLQVSEACRAALTGRPGLTITGEAAEPAFDGEGNLLPLPAVG